MSAPTRSVAPADRELPPRLRRALQLVYSVDGVVAVRVWQWQRHVAIGVCGGPMSTPPVLLTQVAQAVAGVQEPDETWHFGVLAESQRDDSHPANDSGE